MARTNWAGNLTYRARDVIVPDTIAEAQERVRGAAKIRALGSRHCFNDIADTDGLQISLEKFRNVLALHPEHRQVTVEGGIRYGDLGPYLHDAGFALHNLASLPHISIAGACATATHGSGMKLAGLAAAVAAIEFIDADGDLVSLKRGDETFNGAVVNLGCLGIVTKLTLDVEPEFNVRQSVYRDLPYAELDQHFAEIMGCGYSVSLFTDWQHADIEQLWVKSRADAPTVVPGDAPYFRAVPAGRNMHPIADLDAVHCTEQQGIDGPSHERLPHFRMGFTPASGAEIQVEYFVPLERGPAAVRAIHGIAAKLVPLLMVSEVRTIARDEYWMSPFYREDCLGIHFSFNLDADAVRSTLSLINTVLAPFEPRPHWGKVFTMAAADIQARYPRLADFRALAATHDPRGKFRNAYADRVIFST